jgi:translation initiation factor 2-alpha kinase 4
VDELLSSDLLPRKIELEERYLKEALGILTNPQSESFFQILEALFNRPTPEVVEMTFDTDIAARANSMLLTANGKARISPAEDLMRAILDIRSGSVDASSFQSLAMNASSIVAATSALKRARNAGRLGKGGLKGTLKRATQRTAGILAMRAATAAAVTGSLDGVHGADPLLVEKICDGLKNIFTCHGAVHLRCPLLRPKPDGSAEGMIGGPATLINARGNILLLPEDLTASFGM